ncbi:hypothetical protein DSO57_1008068 [Entomophthora muscae]|uniref:Uncharacterized protein n=1 Tax=Entomophthora muscae TaxID=34485 RepID=A0ACC2S9Q9_9FUNG|nr:hypothetical protein DSO57_1008068 [Entomophthora muscae]
MVVPKKELLELPNEGRESFSVNFMNLNSSWVTNQIQLPKENTGFRPNPFVKNDNLDAPKSQNTESESNPGQNPSQNTRLIGWGHNNPLLIDEVAASPPGPKPLAAPQDSASKLPVQDSRNFPEVPTPDTSGLPGEIEKFLPVSYSKLPQSPREDTEPKEAPNT